MANTKRGRDAGTGKFISIKEAQRRPKTAIVDTIKTGKAKGSPKKRGR
jgi:hypothetical protein